MAKAGTLCRLKTQKTVPSIQPHIAKEPSHAPQVWRAQNEEKEKASLNGPT